MTLLHRGAMPPCAVSSGGATVRRVALGCGAVILGALLAAAPAWATDVAVVGLFTSKAVVMVDGAGPKTLGVGQKFGAVTLVSIERGSATFDIEGKRRSIRLGESQVSTRGSANPTVTLTADERGHHLADGQINGQAIRFVVDTGASLVALSSSDAQRMGINYLGGQQTRMSTANGIARAWRVKLDSVSVGSITLNGVDAVVMENIAMPALLGMSFLNRMDMHRDGQVMTLTKRY